jgi:hypothetical protein
MSDKPSHSEDEYFAREDALKRQKLALEQQKQLAQSQKDELKKLHYMKCPKCGMDLHAISVRGVEVDKCFNCRGTFLDEGELEKLASPEQGAVMTAILNWFKAR